MNTPGQASTSSSPGGLNLKAEAASTLESGIKSTKGTRRPVACKKCHALKVKCTPADENDPAGPCIRCVNSNRVCEIDLNATRKRRKKNAINPKNNSNGNTAATSSTSGSASSGAVPGDKSNMKNPNIYSVGDSSPNSGNDGQLNNASYLANQKFSGSTPLSSMDFPPRSNTGLPNVNLVLSGDPNQIELLQEQVKMLAEQVHKLREEKASLLGLNYSKSNGGYSSIYVCKNDLEREIGMLCETSSQVLHELATETRFSAKRRQELISAKRGPVDIVSKGLITSEEAQERLDLYRNIIYPRQPFIEISSDLTEKDLRNEQPFLFNVIMAISSIVNTKPVALDTSLEIDIAAIQLLGEEVLIGGKKKAEFVRSFLLLALWNNTPELFRNRRYHIINYLSVSLLHDLGIVGKPNFLFMKVGSGKFYHTQSTKNLNENNGSTSSKNSNTPNGIGKLASENGNDDSFPMMTDSIEQKRIIMTMFFQTVLICLTLRRSIYVKWTPFVEECCQVLEQLENPKDVYVALFSRLNRELERVHHLVHTPDRDQTNLASSYVIDEIQKNLEIIKQRIPKDDHQFFSYYYLVEAYLHEPYLANIVDSQGISNDKNNTLSAVSRCTVLCMKALEMFNRLSIDDLATIPLLYILRIVYTAGMLLRLRYLILQLPLHIEKELVPQRAIYLIQQSCRLVENSLKKYTNNHFLKKTRIILVLFTHTYATQVQELLVTNGQTPDNFRPLINNDKILGKNEDFFKVNNLEGVLTTELGKPHLSLFLPLEILLHAATSFRENVSDERKSPLNPSRLTDLPIPMPNSPELPPNMVLPDKNLIRSNNQVSFNSGNFQDSSKPANLNQAQGQLQQQHLSPRLPMHNTAPFLDSPLNLMKRKSILLNSIIPGMPNGNIGSSSYFNRGSQQYGPLNNNLPATASSSLYNSNNQPINPIIQMASAGTGPQYGTSGAYNNNGTPITNDGNGAIPVLNTNICNPGELEQQFQVFHDEFWSDILASNNDKINFAMNTATDQYYL